MELTKPREAGASTSELACITEPASTAMFQGMSEGRDSPGILDIFSLPETGRSITSPSKALENIDLELQCDTDDTDNSALNQNNTCNLSDPGGLVISPTAEVYTLSKRSPLPYSIKFPDIELDPSVLKEDCNTAHEIETENEETLPNEVEEDSAYAPSENLTRKNIATRVIECNVCQIQFSSDQALISHNDDKHLIKEEKFLFSCLTCGRECSSKQLLKKHAKLHKKDLHGPDIFEEQLSLVCNLCSHVSKTRRLLKDHDLAMHSQQRVTFSCDMCQFTCLKRQTIALHMRRHAEEPKFACDQCGKLFLTMSILKRHANTHIKTSVFSCTVPDCGMSFNIKGRLTDHVRRVHKAKSVTRVQKECSASLNVEPCPEASLRVNDPYNIVSYPKVHNEVNSCNGTSVATLPDVIVYDVILHNDTLVQFHTSRTKFKKNSTLKHEETTNCTEPWGSSLRATSRNASEDLCDASSMNLSSLVHDPADNSIRKPNLSKTIANHCATQGIKNDSNTQYSSPLRHKMASLIHQNYSSGRKAKQDFLCTWINCGKQFRDNYNLCMHMSTHTGEMQRACPLCRYRCVQKSALDAHMAMHQKKSVRFVDRLGKGSHVCGVAQTLALRYRPCHGLAEPASIPVSFSLPMF